MSSTNVKTPSDRVSDEATRKGLELARQQGDALARSVQHMVKEVAKGGGEQRAGEYLVAFAHEDPEGLYHWRGDKLEWEEPDNANAHLEIVVRDGADGRFVFGAGIHVELLDGERRSIATYELPFLWHPSLYHYGANIRAPRDGPYTLRVHIAPPRYARHDKVNGCRYTAPVVAEFADVTLASEHNSG